MTAVAQAFDTSERAIMVQRLEVVRSGRYQNGGAWNLYAVHANELDGTPITEPLRSFDDLVGVVRVTFDPTTQAGQFSHYTIKRAKTAESIRTSRNKARAAVMGEPAPAPASDPTIVERLAAAEARLADLDARMELLLDMVRAS
jgi:hypothetical protein